MEVRQRAAQLRRDGRPDAAARALEGALVEAPQAWPLWHDLGLALNADGRPAAAAVALRRALELGAAEVAGAWVNLGNALRSSGDKRGARSAYHEALRRDPDLAAAHYNQHAVLFDERDPTPAVVALERAASLRPDHLDTRFYLGALRRLLGLGEAAVLPEEARFLDESLAFVEAHRTAETRLFADTFDTLDAALAQARLPGAIVELGVRHGTTLRHLVARAGDSAVFGFDSFEGLPEAWQGQPAGLYRAPGALSHLPPDARVAVGLFADTLPRFAAEHTAPLRLVHVDCDLHRSTAEAFAALDRWLIAGTVLVFDEYLCNPGWQEEEHRALDELLARRGLSADYLAFSLFTKQAVVRLR